MDREFIYPHSIAWGFSLIDSQEVKSISRQLEERGARLYVILSFYC